MLKKSCVRATMRTLRLGRQSFSHANLNDAPDADDSEVAERDEIRQERHRDRQRERNLARAAPEKR